MIIDFDHLDRATAGDAALQHELLTLFHEQLQAADAVVRTGTLPVSGDLAATLHRLRGAAQAVGAKDLARDIAAVENARAPGASGGFDSGPLASLRESLQITRDAVRAVIAAQARPGLAKAGESG